MKLSNFPQALSTKICKSFFPIFVPNTAENQSYVGPLPPLEYYGVVSMVLEEKNSSWHGTKLIRRYLTCGTELLLPTRCKNVEGGMQVVQECDYSDDPSHILRKRTVKR